MLESYTNPYVLRNSGAQFLWMTSGSPPTPLSLGRLSEKLHSKATSPSKQPHWPQVNSLVIISSTDGAFPICQALGFPRQFPHILLPSLEAGSISFTSQWGKGGTKCPSTLPRPQCWWVVNGDLTWQPDSKVQAQACYFPVASRTLPPATSVSGTSPAVTHRLWWFLWRRSLLSPHTLPFTYNK